MIVHLNQVLSEEDRLHNQRFYLELRLFLNSLQEVAVEQLSCVGLSANSSASKRCCSSMFEATSMACSPALLSSRSILTRRGGVLLGTSLHCQS